MGALDAFGLPGRTRREHQTSECLGGNVPGRICSGKIGIGPGSHPAVHSRRQNSRERGGGGGPGEDGRRLDGREGVPEVGERGQGIQANDRMPRFQHPEETRQLRDAQWQQQAESLAGIGPAGAECVRDPVGSAIQCAVGDGFRIGEKSERLRMTMRLLLKEVTDGSPRRGGWRCYVRLAKFGDSRSGHG